MTEASLPVVPPPFETTERQATVVGVVLAAGTSSRFGDANKLLVKWNGAAIVRHATEILRRSALDTVVVVVGHQATRVRAVLTDLDVTIVDNEDYEDGQATSVRRGVEAARDVGADATLFALGDMPTVDVESVDHLVSAYHAGQGDALAAACDGTRGNPVLFDDCHADALADVTGDTGGRDILLSSEQSALVETGDRGVLLDVDRPDDIEAL
jgi:molybdenum cofactor cytidylyltransferase